MVLSKGFVFMIALNVRNSWIAVALAKGLARQKTRAGESDLGIDGRSRRGPEGDFGGSSAPRRARESTHAPRGVPSGLKCRVSSVENGSLLFEGSKIYKKGCRKSGLG